MTLIIADAVANPTPVSPLPEPDPVTSTPEDVPGDSTPLLTKVAFVGDQGVGTDVKAVLALVQDEGADILLLQGDLGCAPDTADQWDKNITETLGPDFPVLTVIGNHEHFEWPLYQQLIKQHTDRAGGISCTGETGVKSNCTFRNLHVVQVAVGVFEVPGVRSKDRCADFIRTSFESSKVPWRICSSHKNQTAMQVYRKGDATGWDVFDACLDDSNGSRTYLFTYLSYE